MRNRIALRKYLLVASLCLLSSTLSAEVPYVYSVENTGAECTLPILPEPDELPSIIRLPNPFEFSNGGKFVADLVDWRCRRNEIKAEIENYEIGVKPDRPSDITATFESNVLTVIIKENGETITLTSNVTLPESGSGLLPVVIGIGGPSGSLPADLFTNCIKIAFSPAQIAVDGQARSGAFYSMYPNSNSAHYAAWSWGVSRILDGLEIVQSTLNADLKRIGLTGCSRWGKLALFGGAFDERIALTIAQEPGGGGAAAWRVSETIGAVEKIDNTDYSWFMPSMRDNFRGRVDRLPHDHHELLAMIAPRALLILGNDGWTWLADPSGYVSSMAAREVWKKLGVSDRMGFDFTGGHNHCQVAASQRDACDKFIKRFLLNDNTVNTEILTSPYQDINYQFWISEWADVTVPPIAEKSNYFEPETSDCVSLGDHFEIGNDTDASGGKYVTIASGKGSAQNPPSASNQLNINFFVDNHEMGFVYVRVKSLNANSNSFLAKIDNDDFTMIGSADTAGEWKWIPVIADRPMIAGNHTLTIDMAEEGIKLDRVLITNTRESVPTTGFGGTETNCAPPIKYTKLDFENGNIDNWTKQNPGGGITITQEDKYQGEYALKMVNASGSSAWSVQAFTPEIEIISGHVYTVSFWIRAVDGGGRGRISTTGAGSLGNTYWSDFQVDNEWKQIIYNNLIANGSSVKLAFDMGYVPNKTYYIDDIVFNDTNVPDGTGIKRILTDIDIHPNPVKEKLNIGISGCSVVDLYSLSGAKVLSMNAVGSEISIDMKNKPSGIYILHVHTDNNLFTKKIVKN
ncbi:MAG: T9SS type A sorting domain-containing protein [Porphyromonadaceae bacterium]|nr:T9SS type A sorting domain-containing protein [Porphyromonadaceae bacterium]